MRHIASLPLPGQLRKTRKLGTVLTLRDAKTGHEVPVGAHGAIRLLITLDAPAPLTRLRALLVGDVLRRAGDVAGIRVIVAADDLVPGRDALGIAPADADPAAYADRADVTIGPGPDGAVRVAVGALTAAGSPDVPRLAEPLDPAALRLAMLGVPHDRDADLSDGDIDAAGAELGRWRRQVAGWAESPSRPMCADHVAKFRAALDTGLDVPEALAVLRMVEDDPDLPPGSKFETFVFADRILALELPRDIGRG